MFSATQMTKDTMEKKILYISSSGSARFCVAGEILGISCSSMHPDPFKGLLHFGILTSPYVLGAYLYKNCWREIVFIDRRKKGMLHFLFILMIRALRKLQQ